MNRRTAFKAIVGLLVTPFVAKGSDIPNLKTPAPEKPRLEFHIKTKKPSGERQNWALGAHMDDRPEKMLKTMKYVAEKSFEHYTPDILKFFKD